MGGNGSGRKSIKAEAIYCILDVQLQLQKIKFEGLQGNKTYEQIEPMLDDAIQTCKVKQEQIERF
jgi:hypothetical protein